MKKVYTLSQNNDINTMPITMVFASLEAAINCHNKFSTDLFLDEKYRKEGESRVEVLSEKNGIRYRTCIEEQLVLERGL